MCVRKAPEKKTRVLEERGPVPCGKRPQDRCSRSRKTTFEHQVGGRRNHAPLCGGRAGLLPLMMVRQGSVNVLGPILVGHLGRESWSRLVTPHSLGIMSQNCQLDESVMVRSSPRLERLPWLETRCNSVSLPECGSPGSRDVRDRDGCKTAGAIRQSRREKTKP